MERVPLTGRDDLSVYWDNHLRVAFADSATHDLPAMVEASLAHVLMLAHCRSLPPERAHVLLAGLLCLWRRWDDQMPEPSFDGSVEDPYYYLEQELAAVCGIQTAELDVQLARSRNDLDSGIFRMILRRMVLDQVRLLAQLASDTAQRAADLADVVIIGYTHRRPAQPTTLGHVLCGIAECWAVHAESLLGVFAQLNISPLGGAAFAGTDIPVDAQLVATWLGFDRSFTNSYEAIAGADHFLACAAAFGRIAATSARWARVLQEWMAHGWIRTPLEFTQGSSIMPQKVNPVVCEHLASMAGAEIADMTAAFINVAQSWYEDSNNATTDIQHQLWRANERLTRILRLQDGLIGALTVGQAPSDTEIVVSGATTTAVAERLAIAGIPWRTAHSTVKALLKAADPEQWTDAQVREVLQVNGVPVGLAETVRLAAQQPRLVLDRGQPGGPGELAVRAAATELARRSMDLETAATDALARLTAARHRLLAAAADYRPQ